MITVENLSLQYGGQVLFTQADLQFDAGNCYGIIGANGAGKSTFLKILSGEVEPSGGHVYIDPKARMSVLRQNQELYNDYTVMDTVIMGNKRLYDIGKEKDAIYEKPDFSDEDGIRASELEEEYAEMGGWEAESDAGRILNGLGVDTQFHYTPMSALDGRLKVKVLLAQALFGKPDIVLLDEPTNNLDLASVVWLEDFLMDYEGTVLVVSHDRYFLNNVCTHIVDIDYGKIRMYVGNYDFWYESSQLIQKLIKDQNKKAQQKIEELQSFIRRFAANRSKSRQATSRRKLLDKISIEEMPASSRRYPWVGFKAEREPGKDRLFVTDLCKSVRRRPRAEKRQLHNGPRRQDSPHLPQRAGRHAALQAAHGRGGARFRDYQMGRLHHAGLHAARQQRVFRGLRALHNGLDAPVFRRQARELSPAPSSEGCCFPGDEVYKPVNVLSGGERVRCMISKLMLSGASVLLLDQPTNHLDLESIAALNNGLAAFPYNIIFSSHDHQLTQTVANRIIEITPDGSITDRMCTYDEYVHLNELEAQP